MSYPIFCRRTDQTRFFLFRFPVGLLALQLLFVGQGRGTSQSLDQKSLAVEVREGAARAVAFFRNRVAVEGGYVYQVSADLKHREGEGDAGKLGIWVQPPGTPAVGLALIESYERTKETFFLEGAVEAARSLLRGQLHSGGWQNHIEFDPSLRKKIAYRVDGPRKATSKNWSSFDDDQTQSAIRFLAKVDRALRFEDKSIHEGAQIALQSVLNNQFPNGAWAQGFEQLDTSLKYPITKADFPSEWPRTHPGGDYWKHYTLNDNSLVRIIDTLWLASEIYRDDRYRQAAIQGADFLLLAQMPEPQPAWAQQYNISMHPVWARKFEPPAVSGGESQSVISALLETYERTGDRKYLNSLDRAIRYLESSLLPNGRLARFYELKTNRALYFTKAYELTYSNEDVPTHYGFQVASNLPSLRKEFQTLDSLNGDALKLYVERQKSKKENWVPDAKDVQAILGKLDARGSWVEPGKLKYIKTADHDGMVISSATFIRNIELLSRTFKKPLE